MKTVTTDIQKTGVGMRCLILLVFCFLFSPVGAQMKWVKKAYPAVFTLKTFAADGSLIASSNGFFISEEGVAVACYTPFKGASRAVIIDATGQEAPVREMLGVNDMYDVAKFKVEVKKAKALTLAEGKNSEGSTLYLMPYSVKKEPNCRRGTVTSAELFDEEKGYYYYSMDMAMSEQMVGCPLMNEEGAAVGLLQPSSDAEGKKCYAVSAPYAASLSLTGLSLNDAAIRKTGIAVGIPDKAEDAVLSLFLAGSTMDSLHYTSYLGRFIDKFPNMTDGYVYRARFAVANNRFADADEDMKQALKVSDQKDDTHYQYALMIYQKELFQPEAAYEPWNLDRALDESKMAWQLNPQTVYREQQAQILYAQKKYGEAYSIYDELLKGDRHNAETFYAAALCKLQEGDKTAHLALLDSAVNTFSRPYLRAAAPYLLARAQALYNAELYRPAVMGYNDYADLMVGKLTAQFYYLREQAEYKGHLYQQALDDIRKAVEMAPQEPLYKAEKACVELRAGLVDDMLQTATECIQMAPQYSDGYLFLGLAQCLKGQKTEGVQNLQKAKELGNSQAQSLIEKYSK
jgi:tetratricopeptide (TPR) repeat protein